MLANALGVLLVAALILLPGVLLVVAAVLLVRELRQDRAAAEDADAAQQGQTPGSQLDSPPPPSPPWPLA